MPIRLDSQRAFRPIQLLPFCYLCGEGFSAGAARNSDHVPPYSLFLPEHRDFPLILPTHVICNNGRSEEDQLVTQLVGTLRGRRPTPGDKKIPMVGGTFSDGSTGGGVRGQDLPAIVRRWVRGFHAALYREPLSNDSEFMTSIPLPEGRLDGKTFRPVPMPDAILELVAELKRNRLTQTIDRVVCRKGYCRYECVWTQADGGQWLCVYALDIYDWKNLGDGEHFDARGCVGAYRPSTRLVPPTATCSTRLHFSIDNKDKFDPFGE